jgi:hypothetical protein
MNTEFQDLLDAFEEIKNETLDAQNTAIRVGTALINFLSSAFLLGFDKTSELSPPNLNTHASKSNSLLSINTDYTSGGYVKRGSLYLPTAENPEVYKRVEKIGADPTTEAGLKSSKSGLSFSDTSAKQSFEIIKYLSSALRTNNAFVESGYDGQHSFIKLKIDSNFEQETNTTENKITEVLIRKNAVVFSFNNSPILTIDANGLKVAAQLSVANLISSDNYVAPYNQIKANVLNYNPAADQTIDLLGRNDTLIRPSSLVSSIPTGRVYTLTNMVVGQHLRFIAKLAANDGSVGFENEEETILCVFETSKPANTSATNKYFENTQNVARIFLLIGQVVESNVIYWQVREFTV